MKTVARILIFFFLSSTLVDARAGNSNPGVLPPHSTPFGKTYGAWAGEFNNWVWQFPRAESPFFAGEDGSNCGQGQRGKVWFLAGAFDGTVVRKGCIIPAGKAIFFSIVSFVSFVPDYGNNEEQVRADAAKDVSKIARFDVSLDGTPLNNLSTYRASSPEGGFVLSAPEGSLLAEFTREGAGEYFPAVADGYWIMLAPLSKGEHTLQFSASGSFQDDSEYSHDVTYNLTVGK